MSVIHINERYVRDYVNEWMCLQFAQHNTFFRKNHQRRPEPSVPTQMHDLRFDRFDLCFGFAHLRIALSRNNLNIVLFSKSKSTVFMT